MTFPLGLLYGIMVCEDFLRTTSTQHKRCTVEFTFVQVLNSMIDKLESVRQDAERCDAGQTGNPGTRLRKVLGEVKDQSHQMRKDVLAARKGGE